MADYLVCSPEPPSPRRRVMGACPVCESRCAATVGDPRTPPHVPEGKRKLCRGGGKALVLDAP